MASKMLRIKVRLGSMQSEAKLLRFSEGTSFEVLTQKIATKLGLVVTPPPPASSSTSRGIIPDRNGGGCYSYKLYLGGEALVEDTSEIDHMENLVLVVVQQQEGMTMATTASHPHSTPTIHKKDDLSSQEAISNHDLSISNEKINSVARLTRSMLKGTKATSKMNTKPSAVLRGRRVAFYIDDKPLLSFGHVVSVDRHISLSNQINAEVEFDNGIVLYYDRKELDVGLQLAQENQHIDITPVSAEYPFQTPRKRSHDEDHHDGTDDDSAASRSSVEDVTDQIIREKQQRTAKQLPIDLAGSNSESAIDDNNDDDESYDSEIGNNNQDYDSHADDLSYGAEEEDEEQVDDVFDRGEKKKITKPNGKMRVKHSRQPKDPPLEVLMDYKDIPVAPGKRNDNDNNNHTLQEDDMLEASALSGSPGADSLTKSRIIKLLNTGFHPTANENEAKNAMKLAQRLMRKHNLSQAVLLQERDLMMEGGNASPVLKGGLVEVKIVNRKTRKPSPMARWLHSLMHPVANNFEVETFYSVARGRKCSVTFYGIYTNCQLAAYAFRVAVERISQMAAEHKPTPQQQQQQKYPWRKKITTQSSRLSYALGIVRGLDDEVNATIQRDKEKSARRLDRARLASSKGEAYEESNHDDDDGIDFDDTDGPGFIMTNGDNQQNPVPTHAIPNNDTNYTLGCDDANEDGDTKPLDSTITAAKAESALSGEALNRRLKALEDEQRSSLVLVNHREQVAKEVLEERNIKLRKGAKRKPITFDRISYKKGIEDSNEIDINQRAIRDEVKVKKEAD